MPRWPFCVLCGWRPGAPSWPVRFAHLNDCGPVQHYWVLVKLLLTVFAASILLVETETVTALAAAAASSDDPRALPGTLPHSVGGLAVLLTTVILSVFKPQGITRHGWRKHNQQGRDKRTRRAESVG